MTSLTMASLYKTAVDKSKKVFLGGTVNHSKWRDKLIPLLEIDYFNPVVKTWTPKDQAEERRQRKLCDYCLYVITPKMKGVFSVAEAVEDSNNQPKKTIFCVLKEDDGARFTETQLKSLEQTSKIIQQNGSRVFSNLNDVANYLNSGGK